VLSRILIATVLAAALISGGAVAFLRTDFVANNLCSYAVATIEEATAAQVHVARCSVDPAGGQLVIDGLRAGDPGGRIDLRAARVFVHVKVKPILQRVRLERLMVDHLELHLALDQSGAAAPRAQRQQCLPDALDRFELGRVDLRKASIEVKTGEVHVVVPRADASIHGQGDALQVSVKTRGGEVDLPGRSIGLISTRGAAKVDLRGAGQLDVTKADLIGAEASAFLRGRISDLCDPRIEASGNLRADDLAAALEAFAPGALSGVQGSLAADASVSLDHGEAKVRGDVRLRGLALEGFQPGDVNARFDFTPRRLKLERLEVGVGRGQIAGVAEVGLVSGLPVTADLNLRDMELAELLRKLTLQHAWVLLRSTGKVAVKGTLAPLALSGDVALDLADFAVLDRGWDQRAKGGPRRMLEFSRGKISSAVTVDAEKVALSGALVEAGSSHVQVEGALHTDPRRGLDLEARSDGVDLDDLGGHVATLPWHGRAALTARIHGPYDDVHIESSAGVRGFHLLDLSLGDVAAQVDFHRLTLAFDQVRGSKDRSSYAGRVRLDFGEPGTPVDAHLELSDAYIHDLIDLAVGLVPTLQPLNGIQDVDGRVSGVLEVKGPVAGPDGETRLRFANVSLWGQQFESGEGLLTLHGSEPRLQIDQLVLHRGSAAVEVGGRFGPAWQLEIDAKTKDFDLSLLDPPAVAQLRGPFEASAQVRGVAEHPLVDAKAIFLDGHAGKAELGDGKLTMQIDGKTMRWHGTIGTHVLDGQARLLGDFPYSSTLALRFPDLAGYFQTFVPDAEVQGGSLSADVAVSGSLLRVRDSEGRIDLNGLQLVRNGMTIENDGPSQLTFGASGLRVDRLALRAPYTSATLQGSRGRNGKLDLRLVASIDGRLLQGLFTELEHAAGTCLVQATVGGTLQAPTMLGNLRIEDGEARLRNFPVAARELNGSVSFSEGALVIDDLRGKLNNGEAKVSGGVELKHLAPQKIDLSAHLTDVNLRLQDNLPATVDGDVTLFGPPLEPLLGGSINLSRIRYTEDLDIERSLLDFSRRPPPPRAVGKSALLVHFDLDVHLGQSVRIENNLARADLKGDLKVTGTSRNPGMLGSVNTVHGTAQFRGNEFQIEQGVLSFTDRTRVRPSFDFQALAQVKERLDAKEYKVRLHAYGTPADPRVTLSSEPALAEADLTFLLTFGFVSSDLQTANFKATDSGLAIMAETLSKMTGFSEQVRRFIPKNTILRDPNIDFASDFSVATSRLEPMARFRSHVLTDRMDLKVLEGLSTRRYRGVVSYQLSDALSGQLQLDNEHLTTGTDFGIDLKLKWEGE
jgi:translocation and assembly module TamB